MGEAAPDSGHVAQARQRLDKWLFFARLAKTRSIAQNWIAAGRVRLNDTVMKQAAHNVKPGDRIEVSVERRHLVVVVLNAGTRRGPFEEARLLYEDRTPVVERQQAGGPESAERDPGAGRPTKKQRRAIDRLLDFDRE